MAIKLSTTTEFRVQFSAITNRILALNKLRENILVKFSWLILAALYLYQFVLISKYSVDIPFKDEWVYLKPGHPLCLPDSLNLHWLFSRISEHNIVTTNLLTWLNFKLFGLDFYKQKIFNYLLFSMLLLALVCLKNRLIGKGSFRLFPAFLFFLLSPIAVENHTWAFQSQIHLVLLFFVLLLTCLQGKRVTTVETVIFVTAAILTIYSFAAGIILVFICLIFRNLHIVDMIASDKIERRAGLLNAATSTVIIGSIIALWFTGYRKPDYIPPGVWPSEAAFWDYVFNMLSFGFGFDSQSLFPGIFILLLSILPLVIFLFDKKKRLDPEVLSIAAAIIAILAVLASISFGRASLGGAKTSRYAEISFMLIPFVAMAWWVLLKNSAAKTIVLSLLWLACFCSFLDNWSPALYLEVYQSDRSVRDCVSNFYRFGGDALCQEYWITPAHLEKAKQLKIHFTEPK